MSAPFKLYLNDSERKRLDQKVDLERAKFPGISASEVIKRALFERRTRKAGLNVQLVDLFLLSEMQTSLNGLIADYRSGKDIILGLNELKKMLDDTLGKL